MVAVIAVALLASSPRAQSDPGKALDIYVVDVEGGNATLFASPSGESLLIDSGNAGAAAIRDAERIVAAAKAAGLTRIDTLVTTHWHGDHYGGMAELAARLPIRTFIDHGPNVQPAPATDQFLQTVYPQLYAKGQHRVAKPGDKIPMTGVNITIVSSAGEVIKSAVPGGGTANPACANFKPGEGNAEDPMSVGTYVTFGRFRTVHLGDLTKQKEFELLCPTNRIGRVDVFLGLHHGVDSSNSEVIHGLRPRVAIMNNGTRKGGPPDVMKVVFSSPGLEDLWQMHFSQLSGQEYTVPGMFIANLLDEPSASMPIAPIAAPPPGPGAAPAPVHNGQAYWIKVSAKTDGSFTVTNTRNQFSKSYAAITASGTR
jgi:beta-lactamase superfamily II metal-dependent hydrolase